MCNNFQMAKVNKTRKCTISGGKYATDQASALTKAKEKYVGCSFLHIF